MAKKEQEENPSLLEILDELEKVEGEAATLVVGEDLAPLPPVASVASPSPALPAPSPSASPSIAELLKQPVRTLEDIAAVFRSAMTPAKLMAYAQDCPTPIWLDWMIKLSPKQIKLDGKVDIRAAFINLGPPNIK
jgi:hypothetical protein